MRTAIYGGTFNPIHNAHIHLACQFMRLVGFDRVIFIPTRTPPHKQEEDLASARERYRMCQLVAHALPFPAEVSDLEISRKGTSYTADTLTDMQALYPGDKFFLLMGEDMFLTLAQWYHPEEIYRKAVLCAAPRSHGGLQKMEAYAKTLRKKGAMCILKDISYLPISSTMVRNAVRRKESIGEWVPLPVAAYIYEQGLYGAGKTTES